MCSSDRDLFSLKREIKRLLSFTCKMICYVVSHDPWFSISTTRETKIELLV